jgi:acyl-CoA thioesterase-1
VRASIIRFAAVSFAASVILVGCSVSGGPILPTKPPRSGRLTVVFLGDSLTAGEGIGKELAFAARMQEYWAGKGIPYTAINEGVSGDTTADVLARFDSSRAPAAELTILEIGANDAFQRVPVDVITSNMRLIVQKIRKGGSRVALSGMYFSSDMLGGDEDYTRRFNALYAEVARAEKVPLMPALLRSLFTRADVWQSDGLHPTAEGHALIARDMLADLNPAWKK